MLVGNRKPETAREFARFMLGHIAEWKAQEIKLLAGRREQEIALVALSVAGAIHCAAAIGKATGGNVVSGRQDARAEITGGRKQILELDRHVAMDAGNRRLTGNVACRERINHRFSEARLVVEDVMGD